MSTAFSYCHLSILTYFWKRPNRKHQFAAEPQPQKYPMVLAVFQYSLSQNIWTEYFQWAPMHKTTDSESDTDTLKYSLGLQLCCLIVLIFFCMLKNKESISEGLENKSIIFSKPMTTVNLSNPWLLLLKHSMQYYFQKQVMISVFLSTFCGHSRSKV